MEPVEPGLYQPTGAKGQWRGKRSRSSSRRLFAVTRSFILTARATIGSSVGIRLPAAFPLNWRNRARHRTAPAGPRRCGVRTRDRVPALVEPRRGFGQGLPILVRRDRQAERHTRHRRVAPGSTDPVLVISAIVRGRLVQVIFVHGQAGVSADDFGVSGEVR